MKGKTMKREAGGKVPASTKEVKAGGNPYVFEEAAKRKRGGAMHGAKAKHRLDKPGRKMGGRAGADKSPLSSAHKKSGGFDPD